jgi:hypothetical protein
MMEKLFGEKGYFTRDVGQSHSVLIICSYLLLLLVFCLSKL